MGFGGHHRFPTLYLSKKIKDKAGLTFNSCPGFKELREDDTEGGSKGGGSGLSSKEFNKQVEKHDETKKTKEQRKKSVKRDPSLKEIRDHLRKIIKYHCQKVNEAIPSLYPILGPVNLEGEEGEDGSSKRGGQKMLNTKGEFKRYGY